MKKLFLFVLLLCLTMSVFARESKQITPADAQINASQMMYKSFLTKTGEFSVDFGRNREVLFDQTLELTDWSFGVSDVNSLGPYYHADNFFDVVGTITGVSFTGLCLSNPWAANGEDPMTFDINFYADNAGVIGDLVVTHEVTLDRVATGLQFSGFDAFTWTGDLPAGVQMAEGWISIVGTSVGTPTDGWLLWGNSPDGDGLEYADDGSGTGWVATVPPAPDRCFTLTGTVAAPVSPAAPTDFVAVPDAGGALSCELSWINPSLDYAGNVLTDLDEINLYRGTDLIYTDSAPLIGEPASYEDVSVPASGTYSYSVVGVNDAGEGVSANAGPVWIGEDVPNVVTDLLLEGIDMDGYLTWVNPITGLNGGAFNEAILGYYIVRNDGEEFEVTGLATEYTDTTIPGIGNYFYSVQAYNSIGDGGIAVSNATLIADENLLVLEGFEEWLPGDWTLEGGVNWTHSQTNIAGGTVPEAHFQWSPSATATQRLISPILDTSGANALALEFMHSINDYNGDYTLSIQTSSDGATWNDVVIIPSVTIPATLFAETVITPDVGSATFQIAWVFDGNSFNINDWWVDDVLLSILEHGNVDGIVTNSATSSPIEGVEVFVGPFGPAVTNAAGEYLLEGIVTGMQPVTAFIDGYYDFIGEVDVEADITVTYDFMMDPFEFATLDGTVTDLDTGDPLEGAEISMVSVLGYTYDAVTGTDGTYSIVDIVADTYDIICTAPMHIPENIMGMTFDSGVAITQDFVLGLSISYFSDFEDNDGYLLSNDTAGWQWGAPTNGPGAAYSGDNLWATVLGGDYGASSNWTLDTTIPVGIVTSAYILEFWHWYDIEASYDGGNVKVSIDNGATWSVLTPNTPYPGTANTSNPLNGEPIYCGHDQMVWELAQFDLAAYVGENILIRWHFGCDSSVQFAGWFIDDVAIYEQEYGSIEGTVSAFGSGDVIENAEVTVGPYSAVSGADGSYVIEGVVTGTYTIECEHELYLPATIEDVSVEAGTATIQDISMLWSEIVVDVTELNSVLAEDATETQTFVITNDGPGDLEYSIGYDFPVTVTISETPGKEVAPNQRSANTAAKNARRNSSDNDLAPHAFSNIVSTPPTDEIYDLQFQFPVGVGGGEAGIETDGSYIYTTKWNGTVFYKYELDGTYIDEFSVDGCPGEIRDLAYDGEYFYGASATNTVYQMDFDTQTTIGTINAPIAVRAIAYDSVNDGFWGNNWSDQITLFDRNGSTLDSFACGAVNSFYGFAWEDVLDGGPYLWGCAQSGNGNDLVKMDIANGGAQVEVYDIANSGITYAAGVDICGGLFITDAIVPGKWTIGGIIQNLTIWGLELADAVSWVMVTENMSGTVAGNGGSVTVTVTFDATDLLEGDVLVADLVINNNAGDDVIIPVSLTVTGVDAEVNLPVLHTKLNKNYPNPFNPSTKINYSLKDDGRVSLQIYNIKGQLVKTLVDERKETGNYVVTWNGKDNSRKSVASGVYFYKMKTQNYNSTKKMILMK